MSSMSGRPEVSRMTRGIARPSPTTTVAITASATIGTGSASAGCLNCHGRLMPFASGHRTTPRGEEPRERTAYRTCPSTRPLTPRSGVRQQLLCDRERTPFRQQRRVARLASAPWRPRPRPSPEPLRKSGPVYVKQGGEAGHVDDARSIDERISGNWGRRNDSSPRRERRYTRLARPGSLRM